MKLNHSELADLKLFISIAAPNYPLWREGQLAFNVLDMLYPELADTLVRGKECDPFYNDNKLDLFFETISDDY